MAESAHPKGVLLERAQKLGLGRPEFKTERTGPEHEPSFLSDVLVDGEVLGTGQGGSKRTAEKNAAVEALAAMQADETQQRQTQRLLDELKAQASGLAIGALSDTFGYMATLMRRSGGHQIKVRGLRELLSGARTNYEGALRAATQPEAGMEQESD